MSHLLHELRLETSPDDRVCAFTKNDNKLAADFIYKASIRGEQQLPSFDFVWRNFAPPRVKFFASLLVQNRIQCKANLAKKGLLSDATCDLCK